MTERRPGPSRKATPASRCWARNARDLTAQLPSFGLVSQRQPRLSHTKQGELARHVRRFARNFYATGCVSSVESCQAVFSHGPTPEYVALHIAQHHQRPRKALTFQGLWVRSTGVVSPLSSAAGASHRDASTKPMRLLMIRSQQRMRSNMRGASPPRSRSYRTC